jgi:hypothetical protein
LFISKTSNHDARLSKKPSLWTARGFLRMIHPKEKKSSLMLFAFIVVIVIEHGQL